MKVSIITVCYNAESTIEETIQSVLIQDYKDIEYIIVDGQSTDSSVKIASKYLGKGVSQLISEPDKGIYDGMNKGIESARGELIGILNADDLYVYPEVVSEMVAELTRTDTDSIYANLEYVAEDDIHKVTRKWKSGAYSRKSFLKGWMPPHPTFFIKKKHYDNFGGFVLNMKSAADYELMLRMLYKYEVSASYLDKTIIKMRVGGVSNNSILNRIRANRDDRKAWKINNLKPRWYTLYRKPLSKLTQFLVQ